ncbi:MAG: DUF222 domain-containing protein [Nocardioidaceae bacterium]
MAQQIHEQSATLGRGVPLGAADAPEVVVLDGLLAALAAIDGTVHGDADPDAVRVEMLDRLERAKAMVAAASLRVTRSFRDSQIEAQRAAGIARERLGRGVSEQVALACRLTPAQGQARVRLALGLAEMPHAERLLADGILSEWAAQGLVRETSHLTAEGRAEVDRRLCTAPPGELPPAATLSPTKAGGRARALADQLDVRAAVRRRANAARDRRVWVSPAPDTMGYVTALLPVEQAVACFAALSRAADSGRAAGDERGRGQLMADTFVERVTGQAEADAVPVEIGLVMTPDCLIGASEEPGRLSDGSLVPASVARDLASHPTAPRWLRRIFTDPVTHVVTDLDRARRRFYGGLERRVVDARDQVCRLPLCDSVRVERDHIRAARDGGPTTVVNGQRQCPSRHALRDLLGWRTRVADARPGHHLVLVTTPTGHTYPSAAPPALPP